MRLTPAFFDRSCLVVARDLLGRHLVHGDVTLRITEVEAYVGPEDTACHAHKGRTSRNQAMFGPPGTAYVYTCYGIHQLLNLVTGPEGFPAAVLIRAAEPVHGLPLIRARRGDRDGPVLLTGPGKVGAALAVDPAFSGRSLTAGGGLEVHEGMPLADVLHGPRVGIDYAAPPHRDALWRFAEPGSRWVSQRASLRPEASAGR